MRRMEYLHNHYSVCLCLLDILDDQVSGPQTLLMYI